MEAARLPEEDRSSPLSAPRAEHHSPNGLTQLKAVEQFAYLGCTFPSDARVDNRLDKANFAFGGLCGNVWNNDHLKKSQLYMKTLVHRVIIIATLFNVSICHHHHLQHFERFHQLCLCTILCFQWKLLITIVAVLEQEEIASVELMLLKSPLNWAGHVLQMEDF